MLCDEPIIAVYEGQREYDDIEGADAFLDCYHDLAYHVTEGYRIILETDKHIISLSVKGVDILNKDKPVEEFKQDGEWFMPFAECDSSDRKPDWINYESTLFVGERLLSVEKADGFFVLQFDDYKFKIIPHDLNAEDVPSLRNNNHWSYNHVYGTERLIKRKCECGGMGELLMDFVSDYVVRCNKCKKSTQARMNAVDAIKEWETGELHCELSDITIE